MEKNYVHCSRYFYGHEISNYGLEMGYVDYRTLSRCFDAVLANGIIQATQNIGYWETYTGSEMWYEDDDGNEITEDEYFDNGGHEYYTDIYQYFIISAYGAELLERYTNEIVFYNEELDLFVWGVSHWGTSWDYVLTNIPVKLEEEEA